MTRSWWTWHGQCVLALAVLLSGLLWSRPGSAAEPPDLTVFAAASLTDALTEIGALHTRRTGQAVRFNFASSAMLARQIEAGARADLFVSADTEWVDYLDARKQLQASTRRIIAGNRLVMIVPAASRLRPFRLDRKTGLAAVLGETGRLALADPASVPAGRYARQALEALALWPQVETRLVPAENVRTALRFVATGNAPLGIVYSTDAASEPKVRVVAQVDRRLHAPIVYPAVLCVGADPSAQRFLAFVTQAKARQVLRRLGFSRP